MASSALLSAISGLQSSSTWLDVIGNNIANTNTIAYKAQNVSFVSGLGTDLSPGTGDNTSSGLGGTDPQQVGGGTRLQTIATDWTQGNLQSTGVATDVALNGQGFLLAKSGNVTYLTRVGDLSFDSSGNLVDADGGLVQGYNAQLTTTQHMIDPAVDTGTGNALYDHTTGYELNNTDTANITTIQIDPQMTLPPKATTQINFTGNLDAAQQANASSGGVLDQWQGPAANQNPVLPTGLGTVTYYPGTLTLNGQGQFQQTSDLATGKPIVDSTALGSNLNDVRAADTGTYAWEQQPPITPALSSQETVYDSNGYAHQITVLFYQVNDLGSAGVNTGPSQTVYAWYAFDTTGGAAVSTTNLLGGTAINEGEINNPPHYSFHRTSSADAYAGDFLVFNTDGSLASTGGSDVANDTLAVPAIYLPAFDPPSGQPSPISGVGAAPPVSPLPSTGAEIMQVFLNFGTLGQRNGMTGDADGSYQNVNGVSTYVPDSYATATQNGYASASLSGLSIDSTGTINGTFTNGQTVALAQLALADVSNEGGLLSAGGGNYQATSASGAKTLGLAGQNGLASIQSDSLEGSNVDLSQQLTQMIVAQRGFQVNARMVTVISQNLQTLAQLGL